MNGLVWFIVTALEILVVAVAFERDVDHRLKHLGLEGCW